MSERTRTAILIFFVAVILLTWSTICTLGAYRQVFYLAAEVHELRIEMDGLAAAVRSGHP